MTTDKTNGEQEGGGEAFEGVALDARVFEMREHASAVHDLDREISRLQRIIGDATKKLHDAQEARKLNSRRVLELLEAMDLRYSGNHGWESRMVFFLGDLASSAESYGRNHP